MRFLRNRLARRFPRLGLLSDLALVGAAAGRLARRGDSASAGAHAGSNVEMALAAGAALRLVQRWRRRRGGRRAARRADDVTV